MVPRRWSSVATAAKSATDDEGGRSAVGQEVLQLIGHQPPVEEHQDRPDLRSSVEGFEEGNAVRQEQSDPVARLHAKLQQHVAGLVGPGIESARR